MANHDIWHEESKRLFKIRQNLALEIGYIQTISREIGKETREFQLIYERSSKDIKDKIISMLWDFHTVAMNMRGWLGVGPYPIKYAPVDKQGIVDIRVSESISKFEISCQKLGSIGDQFLRLPIFKYKNEIYSKSRDTNDGYTILDRLNIVKYGDDTDDVASCIRITSNWFSSSIHRYMTILEINPGFDIKALASIS